MKKRLFSIIIVLVFLVTSAAMQGVFPVTALAEDIPTPEATPEATPDSTLVNIPDQRLKNALIYQADANGDNELSQIEMASIIEIYYNVHFITDITGMEYLVNTTLINIAWNQITDISPLANLPNLREVLLHENRLENIDALLTIDSLEIVDFGGNILDPSDSNIQSVITQLQNKGVTINSLGYQRTWPSTSSPSAGIVDENLRLGLIEYGADIDGNGILSQEEMIFITDGIELGGWGINDITGLEYAHNAKYVTLGDNNIESIEALRNLGDFWFVGLSGNQITDITPFLDSGWIGELFISENFLDLDDSTTQNVIATLEGNGTNVVYEPQRLTIPEPDLDSPSAGIDDENLFNILRDWYSADYDGNGDISQDEMAFLSGGIHIQGENISSINGMEFAINLTEIGLPENNIVDISPLAGLDNVYAMDLWGNNIEEISPFLEMDSLEWLNIGNNLLNLSDPNIISDIEALQNNGVDVIDEVWDQRLIPSPVSPSAGIDDENLLQGLIDNNLDYYPDGDITQDELRVTTEDINLDGYGIEDLTGIEYLTSINKLNLNNNNISDISPVSSLVLLERLTFANNNITDINSLSNLVNLRVMTSGENDISDISVIQYMPILEVLWAGDSSISDISVFENLDSFVMLGLNNCKLTSISSLVGLDGLQLLLLQDNYLDVSENSDTMLAIENFQYNGTNVNYEPQKVLTIIVDPDPEIVDDPVEVKIVKEVVEIVVEDGTVTAEIDDSVMRAVTDDAVEYAQQVRDEAAANNEEAPDVDIVIPQMETQPEVPDASITLDTDSMQTAYENDIGLIISTTDTTIDIPASVLDTSGIDGAITITFEINEADALITNEPIFQIGGGDVLKGAIELKINVTTTSGTTQITTFDEPIKVTIQLTQADLTDVSDPNSLVVYWYNPSTGITEPMDTNFNSETLELIFTTTHFSIFILVENDTEAPVITIISPQEFEVLPVGSQLVFSAEDNFSSVDELIVTAMLDDGTDNIQITSGFIPQAGVYQLTIAAVDIAGNTSEIIREFVIYDPDGGFVTGGGWIDSPIGSYVPDPTLTGRATFGFVSKYKKGANAPTGQTTFKFKATDFEFSSSSYEWLVVAGAKAQYKGTGQINGEGNYGFMLTATDGDVFKNEKIDTFRIKIWNKETGYIIYDNKMGSDDSDELISEGTLLQGGSIIIHK